MKQSIILWIAALIISFSAGYIQSTLSPDYPANGTVSMDSGDVSYSFEKVYRGKGDFKVWVVSDFTGLKGILEWKNVDSSNWNKVDMQPSGEAIAARIPAHPPLSRVEYRALLSDNGRIYPVPNNGAVRLQFLGHVPSQLMMFYYITLFAGLLLGVRAGLEGFKDKPRIKLYTIFTLISFFSFTLIFSTVKKGCELGIIGGTKVAPINELFSSGPVLLFTLWIAALILIFNTQKQKLWALSASALTVIIFLAGKF